MGEVPPAQPLGANPHVHGDGDRQYGAQRVMPAEEAVAGQVRGSAIGPQQAGRQCGDRQDRPEHADNRASLPARHGPDP